MSGLDQGSDHPATPGPLGVEPTMEGMRVLVVEDEERMATLLKRGLEAEGYAVDVAHDGIGALWLATENDYAAIVLDVMLPGEDGFSVCRQLRRKGRWTPIIMVTAVDATDQRVRGLDSGADDYLTKPFSFAELSARLRALIRRAASSGTPVLQVGNLVLDPARRAVTRGGQWVELTPKEFALLELFMRHPGEVLSRTVILEQVWDFAFDGVSNVVDQYVRYLRRKIDEPFGRRDLETVRGAGYRLRVDAGETAPDDEGLAASSAPPG